MKYLFHISSLYGGGAERVMSNLINYFYLLGNEVTVVVCYEHEKEYCINENIPKIVIGNRGLFKQSRRLRKIIKKFKPDLSISFMQGGNFRMVLANLFSKNKYILSIRNDPKKEYPGRISRAFAKMMFNKADGLVFQTPDAKNYFSKKIQKKSAIIFNPVGEMFFADDRKSITKNIVAFGRLTSQKNYDLMINSFSLVKDTIKENLLIYGEGELKHELEEKIKLLGLSDRVYLMGRTNQVQDVLSDAKCFILSSDFEGMPNALLEAVCMLVPSISTDCPCGGSRIILQDGAGILVPVNDTVQLSKAIEKVVNDEKFASELSSNCLRVREKFRSESILKQWELYFNQVVRGGKA